MKIAVFFAPLNHRPRGAKRGTQGSDCSLHKVLGTCPSVSTWCLPLGGTACAATTELCPDFPLDLAVNCIRGRRMASNVRLSMCPRGHRFLRSWCPLRHIFAAHRWQTSAALRFAGGKFSLSATPLINRVSRLDSSAFSRAYESVPPWRAIGSLCTALPKRIPLSS